MNKTLLKLIFAALLAVTVTGCAEYSKLLESTDYEMKYYKALEYYEVGRPTRTVQLLEDIRHYLAGTPREDSLNFFIGAAYYRMGDFETSGYYLDMFRQTFGRSPFLEEAEYLYAKGFYYSSPAPNRDQSATFQALKAINEYLDRYPNSVKKEELEANIDELWGKLHDKVFINAKVYYTTRRYKAAVVALKNALAEYPDTRHREEILYLIAKSSYLLALNSIEELQRDRYLDMMDAYYNFVSEYSESKYGKEVDKMQEAAKKYIARFGEEVENEEIITPTDGN